MAKFDNSPIVIKKLEFLSKYSSLVTITPTSLTTKRIQIIFPESIPLLTGVPSLTLRIPDLIHLLNKTDECEILNTHIIIKYEISEIEIERKFKKYEEVLELPCSDPSLSIKVGKIQVLSEDDYTIKGTNTGIFEMTSSHIIETSIKYNNCSILNDKISEVNKRVKSKDLKVVESYSNDKIFCFFSDYILVYILEDQITNIVLLPILQG